MWWPHWFSFVFGQTCEYFCNFWVQSCTGNGSGIWLPPGAATRRTSGPRPLIHHPAILPSSCAECVCFGFWFVFVGLARRVWGGGADASVRACCMQMRKYALCRRWHSGRGCGQGRKIQFNCQQQPGTRSTPKCPVPTPIIQTPSSSCGHRPRRQFRGLSLGVSGLAHPPPHLFLGATTAAQLQHSHVI